MKGMVMNQANRWNAMILYLQKDMKEMKKPKKQIAYTHQVKCQLLKRGLADDYNII